MGRTRKTRSLNFWSAVRPTSPVPSTYAGLPEDMDDWGCDLWIIYYKRMKEAMGKQKAIDTLLIDADRTGWFADLEFCKGDCSFINYFKSEGIPTGNFITDIYCATGETVTDIIEGVGGVAKGAGNTAKFIGMILPIATIGALAYGAHYLYKQHNG